jgi:RNA ligase (TIGR02306 family)
MTEITRKLASIKEITEIRPIPDADAIECAIVGGGWPVVVKKGEFKVGDLALYLEIDSWVPHELAPFLSKGKEPREYNGVKGERLRTVKLRGQISQGLLLPTTVITDIWHNLGVDDPWMPRFFHLFEGDDHTEFLFEKRGLQKWEAPIPACLAGKVKGNFPSWIQKTDQERVQNLVRDVFIDHKEDSYEVTIKLDGSSMTAYVREGSVGVCSRNLDLTETEENTFWNTARSTGILESLLEYHQRTGRNIALQGELMGEGIQNNPENLKGHEFFLFDIFDIDKGSYVPPSERMEILSSLTNPVKTVPVLFENFSLTSEVRDVEELLKFAEGPSLFSPNREGLVFKSNSSDFSFKAISNKWLLKNADK